MITYLQGTLVEASPLRAVIDVNGIGYEVNIPITTAEKLPHSGQTIKLLTVPIYRDDSQTLYGFYDEDTRDLFQLLIEKVSGIGPRIALSILSRMSIETLRQAIAASDVALLSKCPGIGKKTAERLVIELRDKILPSAGSGASPQIGAVSSGSQPPQQDALAALVALGYKAADADKRVRQAMAALSGTATVEQIIRKALGN